MYFIITLFLGYLVLCIPVGFAWAIYFRFVAHERANTPNNWVLSL